MKNKKKVGIIAKILFKNSFNNGFLDNKKIMFNLNTISTLKPQGLVNVLRQYKRLIRQALSIEELQIESVDALSIDQEKELLIKTNAKRINYKLNPKMVFGAKIKHGDWIYEQSLDNKLSQIT